MHTDRRQFLAGTAGLLGAGWLAPHFATEPLFAHSAAANEQLGIGAIGMRYQGTVITLIAQQYGQVVAIADVDRHVREQARASFGSTPKIFEDYRQLLERPEVDVVMIGAPTIGM